MTAFGVAYLALAISVLALVVAFVMRGKRGARGLQGERGERGYQGPAGVMGPRGNTGAPYPIPSERDPW